MRTYAVKHKNECVVNDSRSGGIFTALSDLFLPDGVVYGCILDSSQRAIHVRCTNTIERNKMRGSKYVQSKLGESFKNVKSDLENGKSVLFSGTSCQIAGLKHFLGKEYSQLLCVDIVCHGVPSPKIWREYLKWQSRNEEIINIDFRNKKKYGWRDHVETIELKDKTVDSKVWATLFYSHNILRPSCYECPYKSINHPGDITIADYWNIENVAPEFDDNKGVSLVLINSNKGSDFFERIKKNLLWKETNIENSMQRAFIRAEYRPNSRDEFWEDYVNKNFDYIIKKYGGLTPIWKKVINKAKRFLFGS